MFRDTAPSLGQLGDMGMMALYFYEIACTANEELGEYLLASACLRKNSDISSSIILFALRHVAQAANTWNGNEYLSVTIAMLKVASSIPDEHQRDRIRQIMLLNATIDQSDNTRPRGLLAAAHAFYNSRAQHSYQQDLMYAYERYVYVLKELYFTQSISQWMNDHRDMWSFMEGDLFEQRHHAGHGQTRGGYVASREPDDGGLPLDHHHHSDSDGMHGIHDSEEDDEESRMEEMELYNEGPAAVVITGAGNKFVDGVYVRDGYHERTFKFSRTAEYNGQRVTFSIFKCHVSNNTKHWYISIVPDGSQPGTSSDIDFYSAPVSLQSHDLPPLSGWVKANEGREPNPTLTFQQSNSIDSPRGQYEDEWSDDQGGIGQSNYV